MDGAAVPIGGVGAHEGFGQAGVGREKSEEAADGLDGVAGPPGIGHGVDEALGHGGDLELPGAGEALEVDSGERCAVGAAVGEGAAGNEVEGRTERLGRLGRWLAGGASDSKVEEVGVGDHSAAGAAAAV